MNRLPAVFTGRESWRAQSDWRRDPDGVFEAWRIPREMVERLSFQSQMDFCQTIQLEINALQGAGAIKRYATRLTPWTNDYVLEILWAHKALSSGQPMMRFLPEQCRTTPSSSYRGSRNG